MDSVFEFHRSLNKHHALSGIIYLFILVQALQLLRYPFELAGYGPTFLRYLTFQPALTAQKEYLAVFAFLVVHFIFVCSFVGVSIKVAPTVELKSFAEVIYLAQRRLFDLYSMVLSIPLVNFTVQLAACTNKSFEVCYSGIHFALLLCTLVIFVIAASVLTYENLMGEQILASKQNLGLRKFFCPLYPLVLVTSIAMEILSKMQLQLAGKVVFAAMSLSMVICCHLAPQYSHPVTRKVQRISYWLILFSNSVVIGSLFGLEKTTCVVTYIALLLPGVLLGVIQQVYDIHQQIENMNRWSSPAQLVKIKNKLLQLMESNEPYSQILMYGYIHVHKFKCDRSQCKIKNWQLKDRQVRKLLCDSVRVQLEDGARIFPNNVELKLEYAKYLLQYSRYENALKELIDCSLDSFDYIQKYYHYVLMQEVRTLAQNDKSTEGQLNLVVELDQEHRYQQLKLLFQEAAVINIGFWSMIAEDKCEPELLASLAFRRMNLDSKVRQLYSQIVHFGPKKKIQYYYYLYLTLIDNENITQESNASLPVDIKQWENFSLPILIVDFQSASPIIVRVNNSASALLGLLKDQLQNSELDGFIPPAEKHISWEDFKKQKDMTIFIKRKNGSAVICKVEFFQFSSLKNGTLHAISLNQKVYLDEARFLINKQLRIQAATGVAQGLLGYTFKEEQHLSQNFPQLFKRQKPIMGKKVFLLGQFTQIHEKYYPKQTRLEVELTQYRNALKMDVGYLFRASLIRQDKEQFLSQPTMNQTASELNFKFFYQLEQRKPILVGSQRMSSFDWADFKFDFQKLIQQTINAKQEEELKQYGIGEGIKTVRLLQGEIHYIQIEEGQIQLDQNFADSKLLRLQYRQEAEMFKNKESVLQAIGKYTLGGRILLRHRLAIFTLIVMYVAVFAICYNYFYNDNFIVKLGYQNLKAGLMLAMIERIGLLQFYPLGYYPDVVVGLPEQIATLLQQLQNIQSLGLADFKMSTGQFASQAYNILSTQVYQLKLLPIAQMSNPQLTKGVTQIGLRLQQQLRRNAEAIMAGQNNFNFVYITFVVGLVLVIVQVIVFIQSISLLNQDEQHALKVFLGLDDSQVNLYIRRSQLFLKTLRNQNQNYQVEQIFQGDRKQHRRKRKKFTSRNWNPKMLTISIVRGLVAFIFLLLFLLYSNDIAVYSKKSMLIVNQTTLNLQVFMSKVVQFQNLMVNGKWPQTFQNQAGILTQLRSNPGSGFLLSPLYTEFSDKIYTGQKQLNIYYRIQNIFSSLLDYSSKMQVQRDSLQVFRSVFSLGGLFINQTQLLLTSYKTQKRSQTSRLIVLFAVCLTVDILLYLVLVQKILAEQVRKCNVQKQALSLIPPQICREVDQAHQFFLRQKQGFFSLK